MARVGELVLATAAHSAAYDRYRLAVRAEYAALDELAWRAGRIAVMSRLLARDPLYGTDAARRRWETRARANIARELDSLTGAAPPR